MPPIPEVDPQPARWVSAVDRWWGANRDRWAAAEYAYQVVGYYSNSTQRFAKDLRVSVDTVERLAHAQHGYNRLLWHLQTTADRVSAEVQLDKLDKARGLGYSIFAIANKHLRREVDPQEVLAELFVVLDEGGNNATFDLALQGKVIGGGQPKEDAQPSDLESHLPPGRYQLRTFSKDDRALVNAALDAGKRAVIIDNPEVENVEVRF